MTRRGGDRKKDRPRPIGEAISSFLERSGIGRRVEQASVIPEWPDLVGPQIAQVTEPLSIARDGTLFVAVKTSAWMNELSLLEPQLLASINGRADRARVARIRWQMMR
jgi:predicted nucleic acid-binding Zn ribbon protein